MDQHVIRASVSQSVNLGTSLKARLARVAQREGLDATAVARRIKAHVAAREREGAARDDHGSCRPRSIGIDFDLARLGRPVAVVEADRDVRDRQPSTGPHVQPHCRYSLAGIAAAEVASPGRAVTKHEGKAAAVEPATMPDAPGHNLTTASVPAVDRQGSR
jgi:hypothetical protein